MRIASIELKNFKRFTDLRIADLPQSARMILLVGPNGSGKSSVLDAVNHWHRLNTRLPWISDQEYFLKTRVTDPDWSDLVNVTFHDAELADVTKASVYFRTAYRNDPDFTLDRLARAGAPYETPRFHRAIENDQAVSSNYERLVMNTVSALFSPDNDSRTVLELRSQLIGRVQESMKRLFDNLVLRDIADPSGKGEFRFDKGGATAFHYKNLSGGEKAAFDLILDLVIKLDHYPNAIFMVDEPEAHIHTRLQGKLVEEMYRLIPDTGQLWLATHSLGIMATAMTLSADTPGSVCFVDFGDQDFDGPAVLRPSPVSSVFWEKFLSVAVGDLAERVSPKVVVMCEGNIDGRRRKSFDAAVYRSIFAPQHPHVVFISGGASNDLAKPDNLGYRLLLQTMPGTRIVRLVDRDDRSGEEVKELESEGIYVTTRRNLECYLLDEEILIELLKQHGKEHLRDEALAARSDARRESVARGNNVEDLRSAAGSLFVRLRRLLELSRAGNDSDAFLRDTLAPLVGPATAVYKELEAGVLHKLIGR